MSEIRTVGVIGAGLMGTGIAEAAAAAGFPTIVVRATGGSLDDARGQVERSLEKQVAKQKLTTERRDRTLANITWAHEREALVAADVIIESVIEDLATKQRLFAELDRIAVPSSIFASNTSTLRITDIAAHSGRPDRTIGLHFFSPVPAMKLVELAHLPSTRPEIVKRAEAFASAMGKTAIPVLDSTGFVVNRLLVPYLVGAIAAFEGGLARPEEIDTAMKLGCGHPLGPLALADLIGLDVVYAMAKLLFADFNDVRYRPPALLRAMVQQNLLGKKTRLGFYDYSTDPPRANPALRMEDERAPA